MSYDPEICAKEAFRWFGLSAAVYFGCYVLSRLWLMLLDLLFSRGSFEGSSVLMAAFFGVPFTTRFWVQYVLLAAWFGYWAELTNRVERERWGKKKA